MEVGLEHYLIVSAALFCLGLLGVNVWDELDETYLHAVQPVREAHVVSAFPLVEEDY